jgi:hypothetical protein
MKIDEDKIIEWIKENTLHEDGQTTQKMTMFSLKNLIIDYHNSELNTLSLDFVLQRAVYWWETLNGDCRILFLDDSKHDTNRPKTPTDKITNDLKLYLYQKYIR